VQLLKDPTIRGASVEISLKTGKRLARHSEIARGHTKSPASRSDIEDKFRQCAKGVIDRQSAENFLRNFWSLEKIASVRILLSELQPGRR